MGNPVSAANIRQAIQTIALDALGPDFKVHERQFDVQGNSEKFLDSGVSVLWGSMAEATSRIDQYLSVSQNFTVVITVKGFVGMADDKSVAKVDSAFTSINELLKRCVKDKLDNNASVNEVRLGGVSAPQPFNVNQRDVVQITISLTVFYLIT